ncbi:uncharacterized protein BJ171DRAFT_517110 [Polychytrium aggregatum]|uniref:uncharacterized protein n=1 Tax=Polychytrium aggregatum TaxID=110093 RepID=UPI0022FEEE3C|nr:uncharacterized protein BJ171DRAFT_517110 [Polychytrium aggregatum]KAI9199801.1 hypothetical protein BJ171DRAFT_517110 [Polychytrium aggregatum]
MGFSRRRPQRRHSRGYSPGHTLKTHSPGHTLKTPSKGDIPGPAPMRLLRYQGLCAPDRKQQRPRIFSVAGSVGPHRQGPLSHPEKRKFGIPIDPPPPPRVYICTHRHAAFITKQSSPKHPPRSTRRALLILSGTSPIGTPGSSRTTFPPAYRIRNRPQSSATTCKHIAMSSRPVSSAPLLVRKKAAYHHPALTRINSLSSIYSDLSTLSRDSACSTPSRDAGLSASLPRRPTPRFPVDGLAVRPRSPLSLGRSERKPAIQSTSAIDCDDAARRESLHKLELVMASTLEFLSDIVDEKPMAVHVERSEPASARSSWGEPVDLTLKRRSSSSSSCSVPASPQSIGPDAVVPERLARPLRRARTVCGDGASLTPTRKKSTLKSFLAGWHAHRDQGIANPPSDQPEAKAQTLPHSHTNTLHTLECQLFPQLAAHDHVPEPTSPDRPPRARVMPRSSSEYHIGSLHQQHGLEPKRVQSLNRRVRH